MQQADLSKRRPLSKTVTRVRGLNNEIYYEYKGNKFQDSKCSKPYHHHHQQHTAEETTILLESLKNAGIKLLVFDFDRTILKIHTFKKRITPLQVLEERKLEDDFTDLKHFKHVIREALRLEIRVAVATFGIYEVVQAYLTKAFPLEENGGNGPFTRENILTPSGFGAPSDGHSLDSRKSAMLEHLCTSSTAHHEQKNVLSSSLLQSEVLFFDDDLRNIEHAIAHGYVHSFVTPTGFHGQALEHACVAIEHGSQRQNTSSSGSKKYSNPKPTNQETASTL